MRNTDLDQRTQNHGQGLSLKGIHPMNGNITLFFEILPPRHLHDRTVPLPILQDLTFSLPSCDTTRNKFRYVPPDPISLSSS